MIQFNLGFLNDQPDVLRDDESVRGKREPDNVAVIDSIFNIPISAIKQTSVAAKNLSPENSATIDSVLKIPVTTLEAVSDLIKNRRPITTVSPNSAISTSPSVIRAARRYDLKISEELVKKAALQREHQRLYNEQLRRQRFEQQRQHTRRTHELIIEADARDNNKPYHRDPFGFSALHRYIIVGQRGHGDGHVYQYTSPKKIQVAVVQDASSTRPTPTQIASSSTASSTTNANRAGKSAATIYAVREVIDESANTFSWPAWFGILNALSQEQPVRRGKFILGTEPPPPNKPLRKNNVPSEIETNGNDIDG
ncbi:hypothetical protein QAD02_015120 [Eretmocerus hayati]|uniref:Uncharacterized protein n=1 Tax=Eretmocerus hayati TaxID=131215 RepID=A0ACC2P8B9_9HYME|nr:hypothetical protein QAD02_015120 [Eretmocerus hayati]